MFIFEGDVVVDGSDFDKKWFENSGLKESGFETFFLFEFW